MAITYTIDPGPGIVTLLYQSDPDFETWRSTMEAVFADPAFRAGMSFLGDRRAISHPPERDYLRSIIKYMGRQGARVEGSRWATLVATAEDYGGVPLGQAFTEGDSIEVAVFTDPAAARRWLCREGEGNPG